MNHRVTIQFFLRKNRMNKKGRAPVYMRLSVDGERFDVSINRSICPKDWSVNAGAAAGESSESQTLNVFLRNLETKVYKYVNSLELQDKDVNIEIVRSLVTGKTDEKKTLMLLFEYHNSRMNDLIGKDFSKATYHKYVFTARKVAKFLTVKYKRKDIYLHELNHAFIADFDHYLRTRDKLGNNTAVKYLQFMRKVVRLAVTYDWLVKDPFANYKTSLKETNRTFLSEEELDAIIDKPISIPRLAQIRDIFVFACYTGLSFSDIAKLSPKDISRGIDGGKWITIYRTKTDTRSSIPLLTQASDILDKYRDDIIANSKGKLLPVISNQKTNAFLKEIAVICGISKNLTFHMARHTFATTITLTNSVPIESVSKMLGHKSLKTTQIYSKVVDKKVAHDMGALRTALEKKKASSRIASNQ